MRKEFVKTDNCRNCGRPIRIKAYGQEGFKMFPDWNLDGYVCPKCYEEIQNQSSFKEKISVCGRCDGTGKINGYECQLCNGTGKYKNSEYSPHLCHSCSKGEYL